MGRRVSDSACGILTVAPLNTFTNQIISCLQNSIVPTASARCSSFNVFLCLLDTVFFCWLFYIPFWLNNCVAFHAHNFHLFFLQTKRRRSTTILALPLLLLRRLAALLEASVNCQISLYIWLPLLPLSISGYFCVLVAWIEVSFCFVASLGVTLFPNEPVYHCMICG